MVPDESSQKREDRTLCRANRTQEGEHRTMAMNRELIGRRYAPSRYEVEERTMIEFAVACSSDI